MKNIRISGARRLVLAAVLSLGLGPASPAFATYFPAIVNPDGKVTYLDTLNGNENIAADINDSGQVVGFSHPAGNELSRRAFITGPSGVGITDLGTLSGNFSDAAGINDSGRVAGSSYVGRYIHAFITGPNGVGMTDLGALGETDSVARDINDAGQVVGHSETRDGFTHAFITGPNGAGMTDLGTVGGYHSAARGINASGQVVGFSDTGEVDRLGNPTHHAFITGPNGVGMTDLGTLGGRHSFASGINAAGQVAGYSDTAEFDSLGNAIIHAFVTGPNGVGMIDLGTLGGNNSLAYGINDAGQVVGDSDTGEGSRHAFITGPNGVGMTDFNSFADLPGGHYLPNALEINNLGQVMATISVVPEPTSYALMLAGLGLVIFMARRYGTPPYPWPAIPAAAAFSLDKIASGATIPRLAVEMDLTRYPRYDVNKIV